MRNHDIFKEFAPTLENLLDDAYPHYHDDDNYNDFEEETLYPDVYKRKQHNGRYAWENYDEV